MCIRDRNEVLEISDRVTILRKGKTVGSVITSETNSSELTNLMVGRKVELLIERPETKKIDNFFEVHHLTVKNGDTLALKDVNFDIKGGEILGVAGVAGSGQKELCETIAGLQKAEEGAILFNKKNIIGNTPSQIIKQGISMSFIPEDRLGIDVYKRQIATSINNSLYTSLIFLVICSILQDFIFLS